MIHTYTHTIFLRMSIKNVRVECSNVNLNITPCQCTLERNEQYKEVNEISSDHQNNNKTQKKASFVAYVMSFGTNTTFTRISSSVLAPTIVKVHSFKPVAFNCHD